jgi:hypothetical protein
VDLLTAGDAETAAPLANDIPVRDA